MQTSSTGEVSVRGPGVEVAGIRYEEIQCFLGDVDLEAAEALELKRLSDCQKSLRSRLQERETSEITRHTLKIKALQKRKRAANAKAKLEGEALEETLKARRDVREKLTAQLKETKWSVTQLVNSLEPRVGKKKSLEEKNKRRLEAPAEEAG